MDVQTFWLCFLISQFFQDKWYHKGCNNSCSSCIQFSKKSVKHGLLQTLKFTCILIGQPDCRKKSKIWCILHLVLDRVTSVLDLLWFQFIYASKFFSNAPRIGPGKEITRDILGPLDAPDCLTRALAISHIWYEINGKCGYEITTHYNIH